MDQTQAERTGRCLCGAVTITVAGVHDPAPGACHCRMCQRWTGGLFMAFEVAADAVRVEGEVTRFASTDFAERAFCPRCGSHLWMRDTVSETEPYDLMPGLFDEALDWPLRSEIYVDKAMASLRLAGDHPRSTAAEYESRHRFAEGGK